MNVCKTKRFREVERESARSRQTVSDVGRNKTILT